MRDERRSYKSQLLHFSPFLLPFPQDIYLLTFFFHFAFCFKHGRVNLLILQAASHSIYLSSCVSPLSLSGRAVLSGPSRAAGLSGVMDDYQPSAVFHYAPGRFTGSLTTRHENQSLFLILPSLPPSMPASLLPSHTLRFNISSVTKNKKKIFRNGEMCAKQHRNLCADTGKRLLLLRVIVDVSEGNSMFRMIRSVFDSLSCPSSSSSSPLLPAPSQTYSTYIHPHSSCC